MKANPWTDEHVAMMMRLRAAKSSFLSIAETLNSTFGTTYTRNAIAGRLSCEGMKERLQRPSPWTDAMDAFIRAHRATMLPSELTRRLNEKFGTSFTKEAMLGRARRIGAKGNAEQIRRLAGEAIAKWAPEHDDFLRQHRDKFSARAIAALLNEKFGTTFSRQAIGARFFALGLSVPKHGCDGPLVQKINARKRAGGPPIVIDKFKPRIADVISRRVPLLDLRAMECRWADEDRNEVGLHTFCGHPTADGSSYCPAHAEINRGRGTASERAALDTLRSAA